MREKGASRHSAGGQLKPTPLVQPCRVQPYAPLACPPSPWGAKVLLVALPPSSCPTPVPGWGQRQQRVPGPRGVVVATSWHETQAWQAACTAIQPEGPVRGQTSLLMLPRPSRELLTCCLPGSIGAALWGRRRGGDNPVKSRYGSSTAALCHCHASHPSMPVCNPAHLWPLGRTLSR